MNIINISNVDKFVDSKINHSSPSNKKIVESILKNVKTHGDKAVISYEKKFGNINLKSLRVSKDEIRNAYSKVSKDEITAIKTAQQRLTKTEQSLRDRLNKITVKLGGTKILKSFVSIPSVGCYIPGGLARYPSSVIMSVVPAKVAGVKRIVVVSPPARDGNIDPLTIVTSDMCGATEIYKTGGAQAIAALAFGTKSIKKVDKITGPGGSFVSIAKYLVSDFVSIDMIAGPTELGIIADENVKTEFIIKDLISQSEHSKDTTCFLVTKSKEVAKKVVKELSQIEHIQRKDIVKSSLSSNGFIAICKTDQAMINLVNQLAPEHLQIMVKNPKKLVDKITGPGLILIGNDTPSSASDYLLGSNHILPTNRFGKSRGSLSVLDFLKLKTVVETSKSDLKGISKYMNTLTNSEGLPNHYEAVRTRLK